MRTDNPGNDNRLIIVDDESLFHVLRNHRNIKGQETPTGAAFSTCYQKQTSHSTYYLLYQEPQNAHLHLWLARAVLAKHTRFQTVIALGKGLSLSDDLSNDKPMLITEARACPYPALYQNENPYSDEKHQVENYKPTSVAGERASSNLKGIHDTEVVAGYCKHPVHHGSLLPWAPEQFKQLSNQGIHVYSEVPAGVYDTRETSAYNQSSMLAFCTITKNLNDQHSNPTQLADWLLTTQHHLAYNKSTGSTSTIS